MLLTIPQKRLATILTSPNQISDLQEFPLESLVENGIAAILADHIVQPTHTEASYLLPLRKALYDFKVIHSLEHKEFKQVFEALKKESIPFVVLKGWALSFGVYDSEYLRPKTDIDILIRPEDKENVKDIITQLSFFNPRGWEPRAIIDQFSMRKVLAKGVNADIDIHLKVTNDKKIQQHITWDLIYPGAEHVEQLGAKIPNKPCMFLHGAIHLLHHYSIGDMVKLIWLFDLHMLLSKMTQKEVQFLTHILDETGLAHPVKYVLITLNEVFPNEVGLELIQLLKGSKDSDYNYLVIPPSSLKNYFRKIKHTPGIQAKILLILETFLPHKEEIFRKYGYVNQYALPFYYIRRIISGVFKVITTKR